MKPYDEELARSRMVESQLRRRGISNEEVLAVMASVPRELFVPADMVIHAYEDRALAIGQGQTISQPWMVAYMTQALAIKPHEKILEIGTGSGYQAAVISRLAAHVLTIERIPSFTARVRQLYKSLGYSNISLFTGDGSLGLPEHAPYDAIIVTAASPVIPDPLIEQLRLGGRLTLPLKSEGDEVLILVRKGEKGLDLTRLVECRFVPLIGVYGYNEEE
jgi:protein-L-isoaspartate(D-aspartate) O-methyltransferase